MHKIAVTITGNAISETLISKMFRGECPRTPQEKRTHNMFDKGIEIPRSSPAIVMDHRVISLGKLDVFQDIVLKSWWYVVKQTSTMCLIQMCIVRLVHLTELNYYIEELTGAELCQRKTELVISYRLLSNVDVTCYRF